MTSTVGIIGAGGIGQAIATQMANAGCDVVVSNSRGADSLRSVVAALGRRVRAGSVAEAAAADITAIAVPWDNLQTALASLPSMAGRIVIDAANPILQPGFRMADLGGKSSSEVVATLLPGARIVKTMNMLPPEVLRSDPREAGGRRVLFLSGDDAKAKETVAALLTKAGFATIDLGSLAIGSRLQQFRGGPLPGLNLVQLN